MLVRELNLLLEDAPAASSSAATGLSKALIPMLQELAPTSAHVHIVQTHTWVKAEHILNLGARSQTNAVHAHHLAAKLSARMPDQLAWLAASMHGRWIAHNIRHCLGARAATLPLWGAIGVDPMSLLRLQACATQLGAPYEAYMVDDIEAHPSNKGIPNLASLLKRVLQGASRLYTITPELGNRLRDRYNVDALHLPLSAACPQDQTVFTQSPRYFAAYLGSINHLYEAGLNLLVAHTATLRQHTGHDLKIRLIAPQRDVARALDDGIPPWVECGLISGQDKLGRVLADSRCCFLPYSFDEEAKVMAGTSFPSKLLDYLAWARQIIVFAPAGSVPFNLFTRLGLDFVSDNAEVVRQRLATLADFEANSSADYRAALCRDHGPGRASSIILRT